MIIITGFKCIMLVQFKLLINLTLNFHRNSISGKIKDIF